MKNLTSILLIVIFAASAQAAVTISAVKTGTSPAKVEIRYSGAGTTADDTVRAFALDISVNSGLTFSGATCPSTGSYYIYPGSIQISGGSVTSAGSCICSATYPGTSTGIGSSSITLEMASLYTGTTKPATSGTLATLSLSSCVDNAIVTVAANAARGGVVFENPDSTNTVTFINGNMSSCGTMCILYTGPQPAQWALVGSPGCWRACDRPRQCRGDADGTKETKSNYWVSTNDLAVLVSAWNKTYAQIAGQTAGTPVTPKICADFNHTPETKSNYRVSTLDLSILITNWNRNNLPLPNCP